MKRSKFTDEQILSIVKEENSHRIEAEDFGNFSYNFLKNSLHLQRLAGGSRHVK